MGPRRALIGLLCLILAGLVAGFTWIIVSDSPAPTTTSRTPAPQKRKKQPRVEPTVAPAPTTDPSPPAPEAVEVQPPEPAPQENPAAPTPLDDMTKVNPNYVVNPIEGEPAWISVNDAEAIRKAGHAAFPGGYLYDVRGPDGKRRRGVVVAAQILMSAGMIELFGCGEGGKEHESVLRVLCDVQQLDAALKLCGFKPGRIPQSQDDAGQGTRLVGLMQWNVDGRIATYRTEDLIVSMSRRKLWPRVGWTYVAKWIEFPDPVSGGRKKYNVLAATGGRSILTTYRDDMSLLDNPLRQSIEHAADDPAFFANWSILPRPGTKVLLMLRAPTEQEAKEIAEIEKEAWK